MTPYVTWGHLGVGSVLLLPSSLCAPVAGTVLHSLDDIIVSEAEEMEVIDEYIDDVIAEVVVIIVVGAGSLLRRWLPGSLILNEALEETLMDEFGARSIIESDVSHLRGELVDGSVLTTMLSSCDADPIAVGEGFVNHGRSACKGWLGN